MTLIFFHLLNSSLKVLLNASSLFICVHNVYFFENLSDCFPSCMAWFNKKTKTTNTNYCHNLRFTWRFLLRTMNYLMLKRNLIIGCVSKIIVFFFYCKIKEWSWEKRMVDSRSYCVSFIFLLDCLLNKLDMIW